MMNAVQSMYVREKARGRFVVLLCAFLSVSAAVFSILYGEYSASLLDLVQNPQGDSSAVIFGLRLPRTVSAYAAGWGLAVSGFIAQSLLKNKLASPFTLGISNAAAFGASFYIVAGGSFSASAIVFSDDLRSFALPLSAFACAMLASAAVLIISRIKKYEPSAIILGGVAFSSLFLSGTVFLQYFADEAELAGIVFWAFGDVSRPDWVEIGVMTVVCTLVTLFVLFRSWSFNSISAGDDTAGSLGVNVGGLRFAGVMLSSLAAASVVSFCGVIAFVGLIAPHIAVRLSVTSTRHRVLVSGFVGASIMICADILARSFFSGGSLPVGVFTSFLGAPVFLYLLIKRGEN